MRCFRQGQSVSRKKDEERYCVSHGSLSVTEPPLHLERDPSFACLRACAIVPILHRPGKVVPAWVILRVPWSGQGVALGSAGDAYHPLCLGVYWCDDTHRKGARP